MTGYIEADHWRDVDPKDWDWPDFDPSEVACRGTGKIRVRRAALDKLQALRDSLNAPMIINSAYRSPEHNQKVGGARNSKHLEGHAFDVSMTNQDPKKFERLARGVGFTGFGFYPPKKGDFIHIDMGAEREWGTRWEAPKFSPEPKASFISTTKAAVSAAPLTVAAAFEAAKPENLAEVQKVVQPMIPYASIFQTVFVICGVGIVAWTIWQKFFGKAP